jgi:hypothetical protein
VGFLDLKLADEALMADNRKSFEDSRHLWQPTRPLRPARSRY